VCIAFDRGDVSTNEEVTDMKRFFVAVLVALAALGSVGSFGVAWAGSDPGTSPDSVQAP
jgi:hypothetical protein